MPFSKHFFIFFVSSIFDKIYDRSCFRRAAQLCVNSRGPRRTGGGTPIDSSP
jgi:hypothetical protein